jgi:hypothetical protein
MHSFQFPHFYLILRKGAHEFRRIVTRRVMMTKRRLSEYKSAA